MDTQYRIHGVQEPEVAEVSGELGDEETLSILKPVNSTKPAFPPLKKEKLADGTEVFLNHLKLVIELSFH